MATGKANKVKFGLKNVHYAPLTVGEGGEITFGTPVPIPGAVSLSMDAQGDQSTFYADDMAYYVTSANDGYKGTLEIALIPDSYRKDVLGETEDETDKVLVENVSAEPKPHALLFEFAGDQKAVRHDHCHRGLLICGVQAKREGRPPSDLLSVGRTYF